MFFQINVTPKSKQLPSEPKEEVEPPAILTLAPFQPQARINLKTNVNSSRCTSLTLRNISNRPLNVKATKLPPAERLILLSATELTIAPECEDTISLNWTPREAGSWRDTLQFTDNRRIKYDVAVTTTSIDNRKVSSKPKTRVLTASNSSSITNAIKPIIPPATKTNVPKRHQGNKENNENLHSLKQNASNENSVDSHYRTHVKGSNNFSSFKENSAPAEPPVDRTRTQNYVKSSLDISSFTLTPVQSVSRRQNHQLPVINILDATPSVSEPPEINVIEATEIEFSTQEMSILSPNFTAAPPLRRETYKITHTRRELSDINCASPENEENFDDSLSPVPAKASGMNFSTILNNMAFETPVRMTSPAACSTGNTSRSSGASYHSVENYNLDDTNENTRAKHNRTYEVPTSPTTSNTSGSKRQRRLTNSFERIFPTESTASDINKTQAVVASSPISEDQKRPSFAHTSSLWHGDRSTVKEVLEADLWAKDLDISNCSTASMRCKSISLKTIVEENFYSTAPTTFERKNQTLASEKAAAYTVSISPPRPHIRRVSPVKIPQRLQKKPAVLKKPIDTAKLKAQLNSPMKQRAKSRVPGVKISKLCLSSLNQTKLSTKSTKKPAELSVKLHNTKDIFPTIDPFSAATTRDPFLDHILFHDDQWIVDQEVGFTKWLNTLLTPPEELNVDIETNTVDIGKVWQASRMKENVMLAETREAVSARYHTNTRLDTLRKAAFAMLTREEVKSPLARVAASIKRGSLVVRQDRDLHRDIGLQKEILELFLSYNPLWLRIGLEVVYGETIPLQSNNDLAGLTQFLRARFFSDPNLVQTYSLANVTSLKHPAFQEHLNKFILQKFLMIVYFLDYAKRNKLIGHDPCLFRKKANYNESRAVILTFSRQVLSGVGDLTKVLRSHGYVVSHKQTYLDEYNYAVKDISSDLRDGVRLCRVMELITGDKTLIGRCRVPAISRLQKVHNNELALTALNKAGYNIVGNIDAKSVADGHREKTLSLLWQIIYKFQAPRFESAAIKLQIWWRAKLWYVRVKSYLARRKDNAAAVIQRAWRCYKSRVLIVILRKEKIERDKRILEAVTVIQSKWRSHLKMLLIRREFLRKKHAVLCIQRWFRCIKISRPYLRALVRKREAALILQQRWRATVVMRRERESYKQMKIAAMIIQQWWRAIVLRKRATEDYQRLKLSTVIVQRQWRAQMSMKNQRKLYLQQIEATKSIQTWWRCVKMAREYRVKRHSAIIIQKWWRNLKYSEECHANYLVYRSAAIIIQRRWRARITAKSQRIDYVKLRRATITIQSYWRMSTARRVYLIDLKQHKAVIVLQSRWRARIACLRTREDFLRQKSAALVIQRRYRAYKLAKATSKQYSSLRMASIVIQKNWKMFKTVREYKKLKEAAVVLQIRWRARMTCLKTREHYLRQKSAAIIIQQRYRAYKLAKMTSCNYQSLRKATIIIQKNWKMLRICREYKKMKEAVTVLQIRWRARVTCLETRKYFLRQKAAAVTIQRRYKAHKLAQITSSNYESLRKASIIIQKNWRMLKACREYKKKKEAATVLQIHWRATSLAVQMRTHYVKLKSCVIMLQQRYRARKIGRITRYHYLKMRQSAIIIQKNWKMFRARMDFKKFKEATTILQIYWRARQSSLQARNFFLLQRNAAIKIQRYYRSTLTARACRNNYINIHKSIVLIQRTWRATQLMQQTRRQYLTFRTAVIRVQSIWKMIIIRKQFLSKRNAVLTLQRAWRNMKLTQNTQKKYMNLKKSTIFVQRRWRYIRESKKIRKEFVKLRQTVIFVQTQWRLKRQLREEKLKLAVKKRSINAATLIQATWRGHNVRKRQSDEIKALRERSKRAAEAATSSTTVEYRLHEAMSVLKNFVNIGQLSMCLACIDTLTRLSPKGCIYFCELDLVNRIYHILEKSNRSLPWMEVCLRSTNILITLAKLPQTAHYVRQIDGTETIARLMNATMKADVNLFLHLSTLLWLLLGDQEFLAEVKNETRTIWLLRTTFTALMKKEVGAATLKGKNKNKSMLQTVVLPNPKPDWGLRTRKPRCFTTVNIAVQTLVDLLNIIPMV